LTYFKLKNRPFNFSTETLKYFKLKIFICIIEKTITTTKTHSYSFLSFCFITEMRCKSPINDTQIGCNVFHHLTHTVKKIKYTFLIFSDDIYIYIYIKLHARWNCRPTKAKDFAPTGNCFRIAGYSKVAMTKPDSEQAKSKTNRHKKTLLFIPFCFRHTISSQKTHYIYILKNIKLGYTDSCKADTTEVPTNLHKVRDFAPMEAGSVL